MKQLIFTSALILASAMAGEATAACSGTQVTDAGASTQETAAITFQPMVKNQTITIAGLTYKVTANLGRTAAQVADAFKGLANGNTTGSTAGLTGGTYSGTFTGWSTTSTTAGSPRTFYSAPPFGNVTDITTATTGPAITVVTTQGTNGTTLSALLTNNTVCVGSAGNWQAQEYHQSGGNLIDFKKGASDPVDPTASVGSWSLSGTGTAARVNYNYGVAPIYNNAVWDHGNGTYSFCNQLGTETPVIYIKSGQVGC